MNQSPHRRGSRANHHFQRRRDRRRRALWFERLEDRRLLATFIVNDLGDGGDYDFDDGICSVTFEVVSFDPVIRVPNNDCTLRAAIDSANANPDMDTIHFAIPGPGVPTINFKTPIIFEGPQPPQVQPMIVGGPVVLDATTQEAGTVELRGELGRFDLTLSTGSSGSTIRGFTINGFGNGIRIFDSHNNTIVGNRFGTDSTGTIPLPIIGTAISVFGNNNTIGGTTPEDRNIIASSLTGVNIQSFEGATSTGNVIRGNYIGTDSTGTISLPIFGPAISVFGNNNTIGGTTPEDRNIIASSEVGVDIVSFEGVTSTGNVIRGNYIGTDVTGTVAMGHLNTAVRMSFAGSTTVEGNVIAASPFGVAILGSTGTGNVVTGNLIGTDVSGAVTDPDGQAASGDELGNGKGVFVNDAPGVMIVNNVIAGSTGVGVDFGYGIQLVNANAGGAEIKGNKIGVNADGNAVLPNKADGVLIESVSNVTIGGTLAADRNIISGNGGDGVTILGAAAGPAMNNHVLGNYIGVDVTGTVDLGNGFRGVHIDSNAVGNTIGGDTPSRRNIISGNGSDGVIIALAGAMNNVVKGNYIGTDKDGLAAVPNAGHGVFILQAANNRIGELVGGTQEVGNLISGNTMDGVRITGVPAAPANGNTVEGNLIGVNKNGNVALPNMANGVQIINATGNTIGHELPGLPNTSNFRGNVISGNAQSGVRIDGQPASMNFVQGNLIGTDITGMRGFDPTDMIDLGNVGRGIYILNAPSNRIGGSFTGTFGVNPSPGNLIAGNNDDAVLIEGATAINNLVGANVIGLDFAGTRGIGNIGHGITILNASNNRIGAAITGDPALSGNTISSNIDGIRIQGAGATGNLVGSNLIGLDVTGTQSNFGNLSSGVTLFGVSNNIIGGIAADGTVVPGNTISRNDVGVSILNDESAIATGNVVSGNFIGTDGEGMPRRSGTSLGNLAAGILVEDASGNFIGQDTGSDVACDLESFAPGNVIAGNEGPGVRILGDTALRNSIRCNSIFFNEEIGTDLGDDGVTINDPLDADESPNELQNYPIISIFDHVEDDIRVAGSLNAEADTPYRIDFYATDVSELDRFEHAIQGQRYIGTLVVTTDETGYVNFKTASFALEPINENEVITATATDPENNTSEFSNFTPDFSILEKNYRTPVVFVPGFFASFSASTPGVVNDGAYLEYVTALGVDPTSLVEDPILHSYDDIIKTLELAGYKRNEDLFVAPYDWRLPLGPADAFSAQDGIIDGVTAAQLTDDTYEYGLDYLGYWLKQAAEKWYARYQQPLTNVHIIAHSMGGVLSRTYIQSSAYGATFDSAVRTDGGQLALPVVANLTMLGVPNRGAAVTFAPWDDNFAGDTSYQLVLSKMINHAWNKLKAGVPINGGFNNTIDPAEFDFESADIAAEKVRFLRRYVQGLGNLLPEYDGFAADFNPELVPEFTNWLLEDLNDTVHSAARVARSIAIFGTSVTTHTFVNEHTGRNWLLTPTLASFTDYRKQVPGSTQTWYSDTDVANHGDGTVPLESLEGLFLDDDRVELYPYCNGTCRSGDRPTIGHVNHTSIASNVDVQIQILRDLGHVIAAASVSTGSEIGTGSALSDVVYPFLLVSLLVDPAGTLVVDQHGNRFGYTPETGVLTEIPGSMYFGGADGIGWIYDNHLAGPLELRLTGLNEPHLVQVTTKFGDNTNGLEDSEMLGDGETRILQIPKASVATQGVTSVIAPGEGHPPVVRVIGTDGVERPPLLPFDASFLGGVRVATGDVNGDGFVDIITSAGPGINAHVKVYNGVDGTLLSEFVPYTGFSGGVFVAAGDVTGDGVDDIITGPGAGSPPIVKVFDGAGSEELQSFFAYDNLFVGGVFVSAGDVNGDGKADIITGAGPGAGPHIKVFDGSRQGEVLQSFFAYDTQFTGGVRVAAGDISGDGVPDIITGSGPGAPAEVKVFDGLDSSLLDSFFAFEPEFEGGVHVGAVSVPDSGTENILVGAGAGGPPDVKVFDASGEVNRFSAFDPGFEGGVFVAGTVRSQTPVINLTPTGATYELFGDASGVFIQQVGGGESFFVDLREQRSIRINGAADADDLLIVNLNNFTLPIIFDGGAGGNDVLQIQGDGEFPRIEYDFENALDGSIHDAESALIVFRGLEPIIDNLNAVDRVFTFPDTDDNILLNTGDSAADSILRIDSNNSEVVDFQQPSGSLTIESATNDTANIGLGWVFDDTEVADGKFVRVFARDGLTLRMIGPHDWSNPVNPLDVNANGSVEPLDVLIIFNELNAPKFRDAAGRLVDAASLPLFPDFYFDTNRDGFLVPLDALVIINFLNSFTGGLEGEHTLPAPSGPFDPAFADLTAFVPRPESRPNVVTAVSRDAGTAPIARPVLPMSRQSSPAPRQLTLVEYARGLDELLADLEADTLLDELGS